MTNSFVIFFAGWKLKNWVREEYGKRVCIAAGVEGGMNNVEKME